MTPSSEPGERPWAIKASCASKTRGARPPWSAPFVDATSRGAAALTSWRGALLPGFFVSSRTGGLVEEGLKLAWLGVPCLTFPPCHQIHPPTPRPSNTAIQRRRPRGFGCAVTIGDKLSGTMTSSTSAEFHPGGSLQQWRRFQYLFDFSQFLKLRSSRVILIERVAAADQAVERRGD